MKSSRLLVLLVALTAATARADLLDDDTTTKTPKANDDQKATGEPSPTDAPKATDEHKPAAPAARPKKDRNTAPPKKAAARPERNAAAADHDGDETPTSAIPPKHPEKRSPQDNLPVYFESTGAQGLRTKGLFVLEKDVVVTRGEKDKEVMRLEADRADIYFDEGQQNRKDKGLIKVIADGKPVRITGIDVNSGDHFKAFGDRATFLNKERTVILEGNARLLRGADNEIRSKRIVYEMATGWIRFDHASGELAPPEKGEKGKTP